MTTAGEQLSQYRILRRLGAGGMAEVFLAEKVGAAGFSRQVAIKTILASGAAPDSIQLFLDEARVASVLQHSAIVQTLDLGYENETLFIVMEYVPGPPLSRLIFDAKKRGGFLSPNIVAFVGAKMANALDFGHRKVRGPDGSSIELVHRDVSPQNILVTRGGQVKLTDFGVARANIQMHKTKTGQVRGKAAYMAPEQVRAKALDGRTDMFALGLVLYEALTGVRAYQRKSDIQSMRAVLSDPVPPIHEANPSVPADLVAVIMKCVEKKPEHRFAHCEELEAALKATYKKTRESSIEAEIGALMLELFGPEQRDQGPERPAAELWQPTISVGKDGAVSVPRLKRLPGSVLSAEIAELLGHGTTNPEASEAPTPADQLPAPPPEPASTPATRAVSMPVAPHTVLQPNLQGYPAGMDPGTGGMTAPHGFAPMPFSTSGELAPSRSRDFAMMGVGMALLSVVALVLFLVFRDRAQTVRAEPEPVAEVTPPVLTVTPAAPEVVPDAGFAAVEPPAPSPPPPPKKPGREAHRPSAPAVETAPAPPPAPEPTDGKGLLTELNSLKKRLHGALGEAPTAADAQLAKDLDALIFEVAVRANLTPQDRALVERVRQRVR